MTNHRSVYYIDALLFLVLAIPGLNLLVLQWVLGVGPVDWQPEAVSLAVGLLGLAGVLGLGLALVRLRIADSRQLVSLSLLVKVLAAGWLGWLALSGVSIVFAVFAIADLVAAAILLMALVR